jgi:phosphatidylserine/phosphatidylglycerophosphate/cardiolipin synthase-like enzyme
MKRALFALFLTFAFFGSAAGAASIETAFSPEGGALDLVLKTIDSAPSSLRLSGYAFTSPEIVRALLAAKRRGVDVRVVVDYKENTSFDRSGKARAALNLLVNAGIPTRTIHVYPIFHEKFIVVDDKTVEAGSFNYTAAASFRNSEDVLVIWDDSALAAIYLAHWQDRFDQGDDYASAY